MNTKYETKQEIIEILETLAQTYTEDDPLVNLGDYPLPSRDAVIQVIVDIEQILFPGYFGTVPVDRVNYKYYLGAKLNELYERLAEQIAKSLRHTCTGIHEVCDRCMSRGRQETVTFLGKLPAIRAMLREDVEAAFAGDPAAKGYDEIIFSYPGIKAVMIYRVAHELYCQDIPILPRIMSEYAHTITGIDIHPGARIGRHFFIDHGTGVVIGETCVIGDHVKIYQGVTLGALSVPRDEQGSVLRGTKRHPTVEDNVTIYSGATILGGNTVIGAGCVIGGNVWLTGSLPAGTKVVIEPPLQLYKDRRSQETSYVIDFQI